MKEFSIHRYAIAFFVCTIILSLMLSSVSFLLVDYFDAQRFAQLLALSIISVPFLSLTIFKSILYSSSVSFRSLLLCLFVILYLVFLGLSLENPIQHFQELGLFALIFLCAYLLYSESFRGSLYPTEQMWLWLLIPATIYCLQFVQQYLFMLATQNFSLVDRIPRMSNIRHFSDLQCLLLPTLAYLAFFSRSVKAWQRHVAACVFVIWLIIAIFTGARALILGLLTAFSVFFCFCPRFYFNKLLPLLVAISVAVALYLVLFVWVGAQFELSDRGHLARASSSGRVEIWMHLIGHLPECILGCGLQSYVAVSYTDGPHLGHPHNILLVMLYELGWPVCLALAYLLVCFLKRVYANRNSNLAMMCAFSLLVGAVDALFAGFQYTPLVGMLLPLYIAGALTTPVDGEINQIASEVGNETGRLLMPALLILILLVLGGYTLVQTANDFFNHPEIFEMEGGKTPRYYGKGNYFLGR